MTIKEMKVLQVSQFKKTKSGKSYGQGFRVEAPNEPNGVWVNYYTKYNKPIAVGKGGRISGDVTNDAKYGLGVKDIKVLEKGEESTPDSRGECSSDNKQIEIKIGRAMNNATLALVSEKVPTSVSNVLTKARELIEVENVLLAEARGKGKAEEAEVPAEAADAETNEEIDNDIPF